MGSKAIRILYPLYDLNSGALTNWLMGVLRRLDRQRFQVDFLVHNPRPGYFDAEARALGARIIPCPHPSRLCTYLPNFKRILREYGPYDVVHSSLGNCAFHMRLARQCGVPGRITHIHTESLKWARGKKLRTLFKGLFYRYINAYWIMKFSTLILMVSREAAFATLGPSFESFQPREILPCGLELDAFDENVDKIKVREELGIPASAFVIGHAGRLAWEKNHLFLVDIAAQVNRYEPNMRLLLLGKGPMRPDIEAAAARAGIAEKVIFAGLRPDVPHLMLGAMDVFVFPSHFEGLGLALVEAQAAGLPCIASDNIVEEALVVEPLVQRLSLHEPAPTWAAAVCGVKGIKSESTRAQALQSLSKSIFNIDNNVAKLEELYATHG
jgi:glycosyltransferase involved in cell wall biosynthesis